jgi:hypothetical protein
MRCSGHLGTSSTCAFRLPHVLKQIDTLLLSPNEAMVEAAGTSQADRLTELLDEYYDCCCCQRPPGGCSSDLRVRLRPRGKLSTETFEALKRAVLAAAQRGYVDIVDFLPRLVTDPEPLAAGSTAEKRSLVREVFTESAANEHLEVLKLMMGMERTKFRIKMYHGGALSRAVAGRHAHVVDFLLEKHEFDWNSADAFQEAVVQGQTATAEQIYNVYPHFFAELAVHAR